VALIGYLFGRQSNRSPDPLDPQLTQELTRAAQIAKELKQIAGRIRKDVATHQTNISQFKTRVENLKCDQSDDGWQALSCEAESLLVPTMKLASELSLAYDQLRKQSLQLMNFAGSRTDPHTGIHNRRAMEEQLEVLLSLHEQNASRFSLGLFSVDCPTEADADERFSQFVEILESCARDTDLVARYSNEEFVVLMPQTSLAGGVIFSERLLRRADELENCVVAGGIVEVQDEDDSAKLLSRADSALYSARATGFNCLYQHNGKNLRQHEVSRLTATTGCEVAAEAL
ncbi:MAG: GGDEF domain-containing protein, partial [Bythopirellula sp.]